MKKLERRHYKYAAWISSPLFILYFCEIQNWFDISPLGGFVFPILCVLVPFLFAIGWALKNPNRRNGILQAVGFGMVFYAICYLWYAMWDCCGTYTDLLGVVWAIYLIATILCFAIPAVSKK